MEEFLIHHGLQALFVLSFLASSVLPIGSEWLLVALLLKGLPSTSAVAVATTGNVLGACTTYVIGLWGSVFIISRILRLNEERRLRATRLFARYGSITLLFSWLPLIGDALCLAAGIFRIPFFRFTLLVSAGKCARYVAIAWMVEGGKSLF